MATTTQGGSGVREWATGGIAGVIASIVAGVVMYFGFDPDVLAEGIPSGIGAEGVVAGWLTFLAIGLLLGLVYTAVVRLDPLADAAVLPRTGIYLGLVYGLVLWVLAMIVVPLWSGDGTGGIGEYALTLQGVLSFALLGIVIGLVYGMSPYTRA